MGLFFFRGFVCRQSSQGLNLLNISARNATFGTMSATQRDAPLHRDLVFVLDGLDFDDL